MKKKREFDFLKGRKLQISLLKMKVTVLLLLVCVLQSMAGAYSQTAKYDISMTGGKLENVFKLIEQKGEYTFLYSIEDVDQISSVNVNVKQADLKEVLDICLANTKLTYEINGRLVIIRVKDEKPKVKERVIKGVVKDRKGEPLPGVTVLVKGTAVGVATDIDGKFTMNATRDTVNLLFSFIGMKTKEVVWKGQKDLVVVLEDDSREMEEVVVTGYQTVKKSNMAGSVSTVKGEDLVITGTESLEQMLQGKLPGVVITNQNGMVGTRQKVRVRGTSTLLGSQEPVWVVDGIIQEDPLPFKAEELTLFGHDPDNFDIIRNFVGSAISWLNPSDIKDVTVLKDASSTAIYGVKAANGVIVITTKKGETGRLSVGYSGNFSIGSKVTYDKLNLMNSKERVDVSREVYENGLVSAHSLQPVGYEKLVSEYLLEKISYDEFNTKVKRLETVNTDWFDILFENPFSHNHNLNISGGSDKTTYYASFGVSRTNGTAKGNDSEKYSGSITLTTKLWDRLQINGRIAGSVNETNGFNKVNPYSYASTTSRVISCYDEDGELAYYTAENRYKYNVLNELKNSGNMNTTNSINMNISATLDIIKGLRFETTFGYNYSSSHAESYLTERTNHIATLRGYEFGAYSSTDAEYKQSVLPHGGMLNASDNRNANYTWRNSLNYVKNFGTHLLTVMVGQECKSSKYDGLAQTLYGYLPDRGKSIMAPSATVEDINGNLMANRLYNNLTQNVVDRKSNYLSFYGALTYTYDERYVLNASIRTDASNRFGQDKSARFQPVWSVGLRWNMGREHFLEGQDFLNELSLRATYGYQGNVVENTGPDLIAYIPSGAAGISRPTGEYLLKIKSLPNPTLRWEKNRNINLGVDFVFWKNKISGSFEYYYKKGTDIVVNREVPLENGVVSMPMNGGSMENSGWELSLSFAPVRTKNFVWSLGFNTSKNYNEVTSTLATNQSWQKAVSGSLNQNGYPVSAFWAFELTGLSPENGTPVFNLSGMENNALAETDATQYMKYMGKMDPDLSAGMNTSFRYKSLSLSASFNIQVGGKKFLATMFGADMINDTPWEYNNLPKDLVNRWRKPGDELLTDIPSLPASKKGSIMLPSGSDDLYRMYNFSDTRVVDASFLRCNNISLSYNLSGKKIAGFARNIAMSLNVTNPFIIVSKDFKGKDPEVATGSQPISRNYTLSLNISF